MNCTLAGQIANKSKSDLKETYHILGVMSGTSLDGIDLADCLFELDKDSGWSFELKNTQTVEYPEEWSRRLRSAIHFSTGRLRTLDEEYTIYLAGVIRNFISNNKIKGLDAVCSHGHTILHQPEKGLTLQIGNLPELAERIEQKVVCNFRVQDVKLGGQGAPLVPIGDKLLFPRFDFCLNLGGFANVSFESNGKRIAYDICPVNIVLNNYAGMLGQAYDKDGELAAAGTIHSQLLVQLNGLAYYSSMPPKSLGLEWVQQHIFPLIDSFQLPPEDVIASFTAHIVHQLAGQFTHNSKVLVTGGGAYNSFLIERLRQHTPATIVIPDAQLVEYKEALIFGLLGVLRLRDEVNCLASVTGAKNDHCSGYIYPA